MPGRLQLLRSWHTAGNQEPGRRRRRARARRGDRRPGEEPEQATWRAGGGGWVPARGASQPGFWPSRRRGPPLPATVRPQAAGSDVLSDIVSGTGSTGFVADLARLEAGADVMICFLISVGADDVHRIRRLPQELPASTARGSTGGLFSPTATAKMPRVRLMRGRRGLAVVPGQ